jgi:hypothetical protein
MISQNGFCLGFILGFLLAGILGFMFQRIAWARTKKIIDGKKQRIDAYSELTPAQAVRRSSAGRVEVFFWFLAILAVLGGCIWVVFSLLSGQ